MTDVGGPADVAAAAGTENVEPQETETQQTGGNPAWDDMLGKIPPALHPAITPYLQDWDKNYQDVTTKYSPYKEFVDNNVAPQTLNEALQFVQYAQQNPRAIYDALVQNFGEQWGINGQGQTQEVPNPTGQSPQEVDLSNPFEGDFDIEKHPVVQQLREQLQQVAGNTDTLARAYMAEREAEQQAQINQQIDQELAGLKEKYGNYDEQYVFSLAATGKYSLEQAVQQYKQMEQNVLANAQPSPGSLAPRVMSPTGGMPSQRVDVTKLGDKDARSLAVQLAQSMTGQK